VNCTLAEALRAPDSRLQVFSQGSAEFQGHPRSWGGGRSITMRSRLTVNVRQPEIRFWAGDILPGGFRADCRSTSLTQGPASGSPPAGD
jgi:hypothetical protein